MNKSKYTPGTGMYKHSTDEVNEIEKQRDALLEACKDALEFIGRSNKTDWDSEITPVLEAAIALTEKD
jgi:hypothetical protein